MAKKKSVTLHDVANATGFSISTISHVINRTRHVEPNTRKLILQALEELGYSIHKKGTTAVNRVLGIIIADIRIDYFYEISKEIEETARNLGYNVLICDSEESEETERDCIEMLVNRNISGLIIAPCNIDSDYQYLKDTYKIPVVLIDRDFNKRIFDFVGIDNFRSSYLATKQLIEASCKHIAFIGFLDRNYTVRERKTGYQAALFEEGIFNAELVLQIEHHMASAKNDIYEFLENHSNIDAILCVTSDICYETLCSLEELGRIGNKREGKKDSSDPAIISYDDNKWFEQARHPVTTIKQPTGDIAAVATELLVEKITGNKRNEAPKLILLQYEFIHR